MVVTGLFLTSLFILTCADPVVRNLVVHERRDSAPKGYVHNGPASALTPLNLRIALVSKDIAGLEKALYDVSTPSSDLYGQHLSKEEAEAFVAPKPETVTAVNDWLASNGLNGTTLSPAGDWIEFQVPVAKANELLSANFSVFTESQTGKQTVRTLSYSIPSDLQSHIELVYPTIAFPRTVGLPIITIPLKPKSKGVPSSCSSTITPACLQSLYKIPTRKATQPSNRLGVSGFIEQFAQKADLKSFLHQLRPDLPSSISFTLQTLDGGSNPQNPGQAGTEANLDIQYTVGLASGVPVTFISVGENFHDGDLTGSLDIINALLAERAPPQVLTTSYGDDEDTITASLFKKLCNAYMQLGARGTSILFASGDGGVAGAVSSDSCTTFVPTFPSGCPFVTSVGATTGVNPETAANFSAGGFSNVFSRPSYQSKAVASYLLRLGSTNHGKFNRTGRAYPDISAQGHKVEIISGGETMIIGGTSCSSPIFASVISLLNDELIEAGKRPLGFLNPFLYSTGAFALNDITSGSNPGCSTNGFPAKAGWDPITGLGTPNYAALRRAVGL